MSLEDIAIFMVCAFVAEVIGTMTGFGAATILTPIAAIFMDLRVAIAVVACFHICGNASRLFFFYRHVSKKVWVQFGMSAIALSLIGAQLTTHLSSVLISLIFGGFLLIYVLISWLSANYFQLRANRTTMITGGLVSGFIAGLIGTGGAIRSLCLLALGLPKEVYLGTSAAIALCVDAIRIPVYISANLIPPSFIPIVLSLVGVAFCGAWLGRFLVGRISVTFFRRLVLIMLAVAGSKLFWDGIHGLV